MSDRWNATDDAYLSKQWGSVPAREIANALKRSRNSVIGRAHRLNLPIIQSGFTPGKERKNIVTKPLPPPPKPPVVVVEPVNKNIQPSLDKSTLELGYRSCRYPTSGEGAATLFCGHETMLGKVYCPGHYPIVYVPGSAKGKP